VTRPVPATRKGMPSPRLGEAEFRKRFLSRFADPAFAPLAAELDRVAAAAGEAYARQRKAPRTKAAGAGYADPSYELSLDWIAAKADVDAAQARHDDRNGPCRVLLNGSPRSDHLPGEMSKSYRLAEIAHAAPEGEGVTVRLLDLVAARLRVATDRTAASVPPTRPRPRRPPP
jgi:hypothetical protein